MASFLFAWYNIKHLGEILSAFLLSGYMPCFSSGFPNREMRTENKKYPLLQEAGKV